MTVWRTIRNSYRLNRAAKLCRDPIIAAYRRLKLPSEIRRRHPLKIHFGCGEIADTRFLNVDARVFQHVHYVTRSPMMPALSPQCADMIYACHVFEHISHLSQAMVLRRWHDLLKSGGQLVLSVPDFERVSGAYMRRERNFDWLEQVLMGAQNYPGNFHFALFTRDHLTELLDKAGFTNIRPWRAADEDAWPKDWSWDESVSLNLRAEKA